MIPNHYKTLGLDFKATKDEIKKAYRKLALQTHPDRNDSPNAHQEFIKINEAYLILYDNEARAKYDIAYESYFINNLTKEEATNTIFEEYVDEDLKKWTTTAKKQAETYAKMSFENFAKLFSAAVKETGFQLGNSILAMIGALFSVSGIFNLIFSFSSGGSAGNFILSIILLIVGVSLYTTANNNFENRKN